MGYHRIITVYPRWRGEHLFNGPELLRQRGLSPLARGTRTASGKHLFEARFIPAGAGNTADVMHRFTTFAVYPRWRGEHLHERIAAVRRDGLSPLARGTLLLHQVSCGVFRFIPAGAGNTNLTVCSVWGTTVYPRWRGEHMSSGKLHIRVAGLSPLARGTRAFNHTALSGHRFIPAGAGNTRVWVTIDGKTTVYPRWRGEHSLARMGIAHRCGLSPLARGTHSAIPALPPLTRFIPAGAGNTLKLYVCFILLFLARHNLPTYWQQFCIIKERITY